jgi:hypothetical protein
MAMMRVRGDAGELKAAAGGHALFRDAGSATNVTQEPQKVWDHR